MIDSVLLNLHMHIKKTPLNLMRTLCMIALAMMTTTMTSKDHEEHAASLSGRFAQHTSG